MATQASTADAPAFKDNLAAQFRGLNPNDPASWPLIPKVLLCAAVTAGVVAALWFAWLVGSAERLAYCEALGAQGGVIRGEDLEGLKDFGPFDVILDPVGGQYAALNLELLARDGRWVNIGLMGGREARLDLALVLGKRIQLIGSTLRNRDDQFKADLLHDLQQHVWPLFVEGRLKPQLVRSFALKDSEEAFETLAGNQVAGKLALLIDANLI